MHIDDLWNLRDYENGKGIPLRGKIWTLIFMWSSLAYSMWRVDKPGLQVMSLLIGTCVTIYLSRFVPTMRLPRSN